jgi:hypothetical protein
VQITQDRKVLGEKRERSVRYGKNSYLLVESWYYLDNGEQLHYVHVYRNSTTLPVKRFAWAVKLDGSTVWV